jgi:hypothetical protein
VLKGRGLVVAVVGRFLGVHHFQNKTKKRGLFQHFET